MSIAVPPSLAARLRTADVLALGEPTHGETAFPAARNALFATLVEHHGFRSVACETDAIAALRVDAFVAGGPGSIDDVMASGFSHGFGALAANRDLVAWMRAENARRPAADRLTFHGVDLPTETMSWPSPRASLRHLLDHLGTDRSRVEELLGDDARWSDPAAVFDAERSVGASADAAALRATVDDLLTVVLAQASPTPEWWVADLHGRTARGLLRYHAAAARADAGDARIARLSGIRDACMAENVLAVRGRERDRGPTLVFAHNLHLQRHRGAWEGPGGARVERWSGAGAIVAALLGQRYAFVAGGLGESARLGLAAPPDGSIEAHLTERAGGRVTLLDVPAPGEGRTDVPPRLGFFPLDPATVEHADAVLYVPVAPDDSLTADDVAARITALPGVTVVLGEEPESMRGARFFFTGEERMLPFATIVERDTPGGDEESRLDRPGVYRLSVGLDREEFTRRFGPPARLAEYRDAIDFARRDVLLPHPVYARQCWVQVLNPTPDRLPEVDALLRAAHERSLARRRRA